MIPVRQNEDERHRRTLSEITELLARLPGRTVAEVMKAVAEKVSIALPAEAAAIYLVPPDRPGWLRMEGDCSDSSSNRAEPLLLQIVSEPAAGLTGHLATLGK